MAEVFISYSRKDKDFVRRLGDALVAHNREAWVDWKDIPLTAEWQQEILRNIDAADNFIFIISPDSVSSTNCRREIEHAADNNKKMLPLFYRPVPDDAVPETLSRFQRLDFDNPSQFDAKFAALITALDTDLPWTQGHTRLLTRAKEWERTANDSSFLLRGKDLREAEQWMARSPDREPKPTTLQSQYILASRRSANRIQRIIIGAVAVAFLIAVGLAVYAFVQRNVAQTNEAEAKKQRRAAEDNAAEATRQKTVAQQNEAEAVRQKGIAQDETAKAVLQAKITNARRLATESTYRFGYSADDFAVSGVLALESLQAYPTTEAMRALAQVLRLIPTPPKIIPTGHHGMIEALTFSRDGRLMASGAQEVFLWEVSESIKQRHLDPPRSPSLRPPVRVLAFSANGRWLAAGSDRAVHIWDVGSGKVAQVIPHGYVVRSLAFSPDDKYLATSTYGEGAGRGVRLFQNASQQWEEVKPFPQGDGPSISVHFLKNGALAVADKSGIWIRQPESPANNDERFDNGGSCFSLSLSADGSTLGVLCQKGIVTASLGESAYEFSDSLSSVVNHNRAVDEFRISLSPTGEFIAVNDVVYAVRGGNETLFLLARSSCCSAVSFQIDGKAIAGALQDGSIAFWPTAQSNRSIPVPGAPEKVSGICVSPDESLLAAVGETGVLSLFDISDPSRIHRLKNTTIGPGLKEVFFGASGHLLAITAENHLFFVEIPSLKTIADYSASPDPRVVAYSVDAHTIFVHDNSQIRFFDAQTGREKHAAIKGFFEGFSLSPDGQYLATNSQFSPRGLHHYINTHRVWNLSTYAEVAWKETGREAGDGPGDRPSQGGPQLLIKDSLAWPSWPQQRLNSPDGNWLTEFSRFSPTLELKEAESGRSVASFEHDSGLTDAVFSPKGRWLVSATEGGSIRLWPLQVSDFTAQACKMLPRNLTPDEWKSFRMEGPYHKTCANLP